MIRAQTRIQCEMLSDCTSSLLVCHVLIQDNIGFRVDFRSGLALRWMQETSHEGMVLRCACGEETQWVYDLTRWMRIYVSRAIA